MIYDCFIFYNELDLLKLRLEFCYESVDKFVIVEAKESFIRNKKPLFFRENEHLFEKYKEKIIYGCIEEYPYSNPWENEFYTRNYFKELIGNDVNDNDLIVVSDVDEIINIPEIVSKYKISKPTFIEMPCYYHFLNLKSDEVINISFISPYKYIKDKDCGHRYKLKENIEYDTILMKDLPTGGHFTYQFGFKTELYIQKIKNFSHQEFNNAYFLSPERLQFCIKYGKDLFNRYHHYKCIPINEICGSKFENKIIETGLDKTLVMPSPPFLKIYFEKHFYELKFRNIFKRIINKLKKIF